jgi:aspartyl-tRNA(Asn)/glutamyl-tRNA(Gln) amidotransferase subunit B
LNSFKEIHKALEWEKERQQELLRKSSQIRSETRRWDAAKGITIPMRVKGGSQQYYISPEPDLPPLDLERGVFRSLLDEQLPEFRTQKNRRFIGHYGLSRYEADILTENKHLAGYYEEVVNHGVHPGEAANWILTELLKLWNMNKNHEIPVSSKSLARLIMLVDKEKISRNTGKKVLEEMYNTGKGPDEIIEKKRLMQINSRAEIEKIVEQALLENQSAIEDYKKGSTKVVGFLMGQIMKTSRGRANPGIAREILENKLK